MKPVFHPRLLNSPFEDPLLHVRLLWERRSLLFDMGDVSALSPADIHKITDVFVTHTHIDHFIGFDTLLRTVLRRETPLHVYGPEGILPCVEGKLRGYAWNLIEEYPAEIIVHSYNGTEVSNTVFRAKDRFTGDPAGTMPSAGILLEDPAFTVRAAVLDHGIPCLAFSLEEGYHININKDRLMKRGLSAGPWLSIFKKRLREHSPEDSLLAVDGREFTLRELSDIASVVDGQKITFVTDAGMTGRNITAIQDLARGSDILYCEAYFLEEDRHRAAARSHLTAKACGEIARSAGVNRLEVMHFSPKYRSCPERVIQEAMEAFRSSG